MVGGKVTGLQGSKGEDLKEVWRDSQITPGSWYQHRVTGFRVVS